MKVKIEGKIDRFSWDIKLFVGISILFVTIGISIFLKCFIFYFFYYRQN